MNKLPIYFYQSHSLIAVGEHDALIPVAGGYRTPYSFAFFCEQCGEVWARAVIGDGDRWRVVCVGCQSCPSHWPHHFPNGSMALAGEPAYMASWPDAMWRREAEALAPLDQAHGLVF